jgi:gliding motility-associated transport system ATP-binding protein
MIEVEGLTQRYGSYTAVRDVSFTVEPGEVVGFLGPNGAGKTTTLKVIAAYTAPSQGRVRVGGHDVEAAPREVHRCLGYLPEHCPLYEEMRARAFLEFVARVRGLPRAERARAVGRAAERCRLEDVLERPISELSKGFRQRVGIAQALVHDPSVVVLDEPTHGLDPNQVLEVRSLVRELGHERTVLFSSHILSEVEATCRRVLVINQGRLVADSPLDELKRQATGGAVRVRFQTPSADLSERLAALPGVAAVREREDALEVRPEQAEHTGELEASLFRFARDEDLVLTELVAVALTLEDVFASLTEATRA